MLYNMELNVQERQKTMAEKTYGGKLEITAKIRG